MLPSDSPVDSEAFNSSKIYTKTHIKLPQYYARSIQSSQFHHISFYLPSTFNNMIPKKNLKLADASKSFPSLKIRSLRDPAPMKQKKSPSALAALARLVAVRSSSVRLEEGDCGKNQTWTHGKAWVILLMAEILHHLGCMKPYKYL